VNDLLNGLRAAGEPSRLRLLALCAQGELTVTELTHILGQSQPRVSRHLKQLCDAGLLARFREGTWVFYRFAESGPNADLAPMLLEHISPDELMFARDRERLAAVKQARGAAAATYFRANAARWHEIRSLYVPESDVERVLLNLLTDREIGGFLDIGTGTGRILEVFGQHIRRGVGIDLSHEMLAVARTNLDRLGLRNCQVRHADMYALPLADATFDVVAFHQVLHFASDPARALSEGIRVLEPGGRVAVVDFAPHGLEYLRTEHAHRRLGFADSEVAGWFEASGLVAGESIVLRGDPLTVKVWSAVRVRAPVEGVSCAAQGQAA